MKGAVLPIRDSTERQAVQSGTAVVFVGLLIVAVPRSAKGIGMKSLSSWWKQRPAEATSGVAHSATMVMVAPEPVKAATESIRYIARQAIFERSKKVFGYELLARSGWENRFTGDSDLATRKMIADGALYGFDELTRGDSEFHQLHAGVAG